MADRIEAKFMSYDDWKALGPLFHAPDPEGDDIYDGTTRERPKTPKWASLSLGGPNKRLGNPNHTSKNDAFTNSHSQWMHIMKVLDEGGDEALKLVREAAREGNKISRISEHMHGNPDAWVGLASDAKTAQILRGFITAALSHYPPDKGVVSQQLPKSPGDLPLDALKEAMTEFRPKRFRRCILEDGMVRFADPDRMEAANDRNFRSAVKDKIDADKSAPRQFAGTMAIFADEGMEQVAAKYVQSLDTRILPCPEKNALLRQALKAVKPKEFSFPCNFDPTLKQGKAADHLLSRTDTAAFFVDGDITSRVSGIFAQASRLGMAVKVIGPDGNELPLMQTAREAEAAHLSKKEYAQGLSHHAFDLPAHDPMAYLGLMQVRHFKNGTINEKDLSRLSEMQESVNDIAGMAETKQGQDYLLDQKVSPATIRLLGDKDVMSAARSSLLKIQREIKEFGQQVIGPKGYPASILASGHIPPYLIIEGNTDLFLNPGTIVGVSGAHARDPRAQRRTSSPAAKALSALTMQPATIAYVQDQTSIDIPETGPQILIATAGNAHTSEANLAKEKRVLENGGCVVRLLPPRNRSWYYDAKAVDPETGKKGARVPIESTSDAHIERRAATLLAAMSESVLITALNAKDVESPQHAVVLQGLKSERLPTVLNFGEDEPAEHVSGNRALLGNTGVKAMTRAGFGNRDIEALGPKYEGRKPAIDTGKDMPLAMANLVRHLKGQEIQMPEKTQDRQVQHVEPEL